MTRKPADIYVNETAARQIIKLDVKGTTSVRLHRARPIQVFEADGKSAFVTGGSLLQPEARGSLTPLALALERARQRPDEVVLVSGHHADPAIASARAGVVKALLAGDAAKFAELATARATVRDWQALLGWVARSRGVACDPGAADGLLGPRTRSGLAGFRQAFGLPPGSRDAPDTPDWEALARLIDEALAAQTADLAAGRRALRFMPAGAIGCGAHWPAKSAAILEHTTMADERVDVLCFKEVDAPRLECHAEGADPARTCDLYRKGKYRCEHCHPTETDGFVCVEVDGPKFDFDRSLVRPDAFPVLAEVKRLLDEDPSRQAALYGHTDTVGDDAYNKLLSERRARAVLALLTHDLEAWDELWTAERWDDEVARSVAAAVSPAAAAAATPRAAVQAFQREVPLRDSGAVDAATRRALGEAYLRLAVPAPLPAERFHEHLGGRRFVGCGELNPVGDGLDERSRRVVVMVFDPGRGPRDLPCTVGDLKPCLASVRPPPRTTGPRTETSAFRCAVYRRLASLCSCKQVPRPKTILFRYGLEVTPDHPWTDAATLFLESEDGGEHLSKTVGEGRQEGDLRLFDFVVRPDVRYRGFAREGALDVALFGFSALHDVASEEGEAEHLAPPDRAPAPPFLEDEEPDDGILRVRLHDERGAVMRTTHFRVTLAGETHFGLSEFGWAAIKLPPLCPTSCRLEWGPPDEQGHYPFHVDLALDCDEGQDTLSSMLHNLGYPRSHPLEARVRAFQKAERLGERGLAKDGGVPPQTKARITARYEARLKR